VAGVLAAGVTPALLISDASLPVLPLSGVALVVAGVIRFQRWGQGRLPYFRDEAPSPLDRKLHRVADALFAAGLVTASMFVPLVVLVVLPILVGIILVMGQSSLRAAWFHVTLARGVVRSLRYGPRWDTCQELHVEGEEEPVPGPFRLIPALFPGSVGEPARLGQLVLPGEGMAPEGRWFLPNRLLFGVQRPHAMSLPEEGWEWKRESLFMGHQLHISGLEPFEVLMIPDGYPETPPIFTRNESGL
jgi:hypothetical protein